MPDLVGDGRAAENGPVYFYLLHTIIFLTINS
jgi:hypothetical protein